MAARLLAALLSLAMAAGPAAAQTRSATAPVLPGAGLAHVPAAPVLPVPLVPLTSASAVPSAALPAAVPAAASPAESLRSLAAPTLTPEAAGRRIDGAVQAASVSEPPA